MNLAQRPCRAVHDHNLGNGGQEGLSISSTACQPAEAVRSYRVTSRFSNHESTFVHRNPDKEYAIEFIPAIIVSQATVTPMTTQRKLRRGAAFEAEQDAAQLNLGVDFQDAQPLTTAEAKLVVEAVRESRQRHGQAETVATTDVTRKALDYMESFNRFPTADSTQAVERLLATYSLHKFERAQLGTLCPEDTEEARTLIPSLGDKIDEEELQELLDELSSLRARRN